MRYVTYVFIVMSMSIDVTRFGFKKLLLTLKNKLSQVP